DLSIAGLRELSLAGVDVISEQSAFRLDSFSMGDMVFGSIDGLRRLISSVDAGREPDPQMFTPLLGFSELNGLEIQAPDFDRLRLGKFRMDSSGFVGVVPTAFALQLSDLIIPVSALDPDGRQMMQRFGFDELNYAMSIGTRWAEDDKLSADLTFRFAGIGTIDVDVDLSGIPLSLFKVDSIAVFHENIANATLVRGTFTFTDMGAVGHALELLAEQMNASKDQIRGQLADALPFLLSIATVSDPELGQAIRDTGFLDVLTPAVTDFVASPGASITFEAKPDSAVSLLAMQEIASTSPKRLVEVLGLNAWSHPATPGIAE
ncbi:MAG: hypothetical protein GY798_11060, partial [Hyphomicrobiales bacterium]|nr:hypothetical protein [Hyphomicrobiales bacterium]